MSLSLSVGQLAARAGVTVRTLHVYEAAGLLAPERTAAGHRRYGVADVERLAHVTALRALGMRLADIGPALSAAPDPLALLERQRASVRQQMAALGALDERLDTLARLLQHRAATGAPIAPATFLDLLAAMNDLQTHYTPDQLQTLADRRAALGDDAIRAVEAEWPRLFDALGAQMDAGADPASPGVQALVARWDELVGMFTGGDAGIAQAARTAWTENHEALSQMNGVSGERMGALWAYAQRARDARAA